MTRRRNNVWIECSKKWTKMKEWIATMIKQRLMRTRNLSANSLRTTRNRTRISRQRTFTRWMAVSKRNRFKTTCSSIIAINLEQMAIRIDLDRRAPRQLQRPEISWEFNSKWRSSSSSNPCLWTSRLRAGCSSNNSNKMHFFTSSKWYLPATANKR